MKKSIILLLLMATICGISACGKEKVKTSSSEYSSSSSAINENSSSIVEKTEAFYSLQNAYDNGWLNQEQLLSIAYHYQGSSLNEELMGENYTPISKTPETLSDETVQKILNDYMIMKKAEDKVYSDLVIEDVKLIAYLGMYGDFVAVKMDVITTGHTGLVMNEEVAGICYYNGEGGANPIMVYKKG